MRKLTVTFYTYRYTSHTGRTMTATGEYLGRGPASRASILRRMRENAVGCPWMRPKLVRIDGHRLTDYIAR